MGRSSGALALPRAERLRRASEIQTVFQRGSRVERPTFVLLWWPNPDGRKIGFAVSRQVRSAVARNRVRRRLREAYRRERAAFPLELSVVLVGRPAALGAPFSSLVADVSEAGRLLSRCGGREGKAPAREPRRR